MLTDKQVAEVREMATRITEASQIPDQCWQFELYKHVYDWVFAYIEQRDK